jgi:hypothetical protein
MAERFFEAHSTAPHNAPDKIRGISEKDLVRFGILGNLSPISSPTDTKVEIVAVLG